MALGFLHPSYSNNNHMPHTRRRRRRVRGKREEENCKLFQFIMRRRRRRRLLDGEAACCVCGGECKRHRRGEREAAAGKNAFISISFKLIRWWSAVSHLISEQTPTERESLAANFIFLLQPSLKLFSSSRCFLCWYDCILLATKEDEDARGDKDELVAEEFSSSSLVLPGGSEES